MGLDPGVMPTRLYRWVPGFQGSILNRLFASNIGRFTMKDLFKTDYVAQNALEDGHRARVWSGGEEREVLRGGRTEGDGFKRAEP